MNTIAALGGRKFLLAILAVIAIPLCAKYGFDQTTVLTIGATIISAILGQSVSEAATGGATSSNAPNPIEQGRINIVLKENDVKIAEHASNTASASAAAAKSNAVTAAIESGHMDKTNVNIAEVVTDLRV